MIILGSNSPRRKELMEKYISTSFLIDPSNNEEIVNINLSPLENVKNIAQAKCENVFLRHPNDVVISADTIVVFNNKIYGKPKDENDAKKILETLSNNEHQVITAYVIKYQNKTITKAVISNVYFNDLTDEFIDFYIKTKIPMDKAGAYAIQGEYGTKIVKSYKGSLSNIIGFPYEEILKDLKSNNIPY